MDQDSNTKPQTQPDSNPIPPPPGEPREIPLELILRPEYPARETFGVEHMGDLLESIPLVGLINRICVEVEGEYFRIHAGDRRFHALKQLGWSTAPCTVWAPGQCSGEAIKQHENGVREALNPAEEANYLKRILEGKYHGSIEELAAATKQAPAFLAARLQLIDGDPAVFAALKDDKIGVGVAKELNKILHAGYRAQYLDVAITSGSAERVVRKWRLEANLNEAAVPEAVIAGVAIQEAQPVEVPPQTRCYLCDSDADQYAMRYVAMHEYCKRMAEARSQLPPEEVSNAGT
jgi:ParB/RepB/Spo0J family partition protein